MSDNPRDILDQARDSLNTYEYGKSVGVEPMYPARIMRGLVAEVERLRVSHNLYVINNICQCGRWLPCRHCEAVG